MLPAFTCLRVGLRGRKKGGTRQLSRIVCGGERGWRGIFSGSHHDRKGQERVCACVLTRIVLLWNLFQLPLLGCALLQICLPSPKCPGLDLPPSSSHCTQLPLELSLPCRWHLSLPRDSAAPSLSPGVHPLPPTPQEGHLHPALGLQQVLPCPSGIRVRE